MRSVFVLWMATIAAAHCAPASFVFSDKDPLGLLPGEGVEFGYLHVPENRDDASSRTIRLPVYRFRSKAGGSTRSPIVLTMGGPGSSSLNAARFAAYYGMNSDRDFLVFEQRGTRYALPALECSELDQLLANGWGLAGTDDRKKRMEALQDCRKNLSTIADLGTYHTAAIASDIEDLRAVLEYDKLSLLTLSYSTRLAQVLMHEYPDRVDQVLMSGVFPLNVDYDAQAHVNRRQSVLMLLDTCGNDPKCDEWFPDLKSRFLARVDEFNVDPIVRPGQPPVTGDSLFNRVPVGSTAALPGLPAAMHSLLDAPRSSFAHPPAPNEPSGFALGMRLSVWCAEEGGARSATEDVRPNAVFPREACVEWNVPRRSISELLPTGSDTPVLMFAGKFDPFTPPAWAHALADMLDHAEVILWPTMSHQTLTHWDSPCPLAVAQSFFAAGLSGMDKACASGFQELEFTDLESRDSSE